MYLRSKQMEVWEVYKGGAMYQAWQEGEGGLLGSQRKFAAAVLRVSILAIVLLHVCIHTIVYIYITTCCTKRGNGMMLRAGEPDGRIKNVVHDTHREVNAYGVGVARGTGARARLLSLACGDACWTCSLLASRTSS
eukprot:TRINITY_DN15249_c0_g1_i1.p1 TRINITY_DN15249_c0_g1~~TRINITY_DN15249_c0_g1_i1.p1  ORF type:complete len:136 (+),score=3.08 TRINITY_DN15249_c0_g1_i1:715-1122(+)